MRARLLGWSGAACLAIGLSIGCQLIGGITAYDADPLPGQACSLPSPKSGNGRIRLANLATVGTSDFCIRTTGSSSWGRPVFRDGGLTGLCSHGLDYAQVTVPFAVAAGKIDVKAIPAGSTCDHTATSQVTGVAVGDSTQGAPVVTVARMFGGSSAEAMVGLPEEPGQGTVSYIRIVNAISGGQEINAGLPDLPALPANVATPMFPVPIPPGHVEPPGKVQAGPIDAEGYLAFGVGVLNLGVTYQGSTSALFVWQSPAVQDSQTAFAIGDPKDPAHVVRGLICESTGSAATADGSANVGVSDAGVQNPQLLANCKLTDLATIGIDVLDVSLYGTYAPFENDRRTALMNAIAGRTGSDIMCVTGAPSLADQQAIAAAGSGGDAGTGRFLYHYYPSPPLDLDAQATDPAGIDGGVPPLPTSPPCGNGVNVNDVDQIYSCASTHCSTAAPGDMSGTLQESTTCLKNGCLFILGNLYNQGSQQNKCFDCIIDYLVSGYSFSYGRNECLNDTRQPYYFNGASTTEILSHFRLSNKQVYVLPSSNTRRSVLYAQVQLDPEPQPIDFYCLDLTSSTTEGLLPYTGNYGHDGTLPEGGIENGWEEEQDLQARDAIGFILSNSQKTGHPAIIAGDWETSVAYPPTTSADGGGGGPLVVANLAPEVSALLGNAFVKAVPSSYVPQCDLCPSPQNVYNGSSSPYDERNVFLYNPTGGASAFPQQATTQVSLWGQDPSVMLMTTPYETPPASTGPISPVFPRLVRVRRPVSAGH